jgi:hypothetical protein
LSVPFRVLAEGLLFVACRRRDLCGVPVLAFGAGDSEDAWRGVEGALALVNRIDPRRFKRLRSDLRRVVVTPVKTSSFSPISRTCYLAERLAATVDIAAVASTLVHEAVHARLQSAGLLYKPGLRVRMEVICIKEQIAFAERLTLKDYSKREALLQHLQTGLQRYCERHAGGN